MISENYDKTVWRDFKPRTDVYVPKCSFCGRYKGTLKIHWFFTGVYCIDCIEEGLYGGAISWRKKR